MAKPLKKEERRRQLLDAAIEAFGSKGYHETQVSDIIECAGVARGTFYLHFTGKREIFDAVMEELFDRIQSLVKRLPRDGSEQIPAQLRGNIERVIELFAQQPLYARLLFSTVGLDGEQDAPLRQFYEQLLTLIKSGLTQGQEMGFVRRAHTEALAVSLLGTVKEVLYQGLLGTSRVETKLLVDEIFRLVLQGVAHPSLLPELDQILVSAPKA